MLFHLKFKKFKNFLPNTQFPMKSTYFDYLNSLDKQQLIDLLYKPYIKRGDYPAISKRTVALRLSYNGENYKGVQYHKHKRSVYDCLQNALEICEIGANIVFCGRTDAGVSAISMVVSVEMNSRLEEPSRTFKISENEQKEYPYDTILNMVLPDDIRVTGWAPVPDNFSARYDCIQRHYKYFFILNGMDIDKMRDAMVKIGKMEDFYTLSTHSNPKAIYKRTIDEINIMKVNTDGSGIIASESNKENILDGIAGLKINKNRDVISDDLYYLDIKAGGFLHNMVRKIFWVIQNCGKGNPFTLKNVEIAESGSLVFVGAKYKEELNFIGNKYNKIQFKHEFDNAKIKAAIAQLRLYE